MKSISCKLWSNFICQYHIRWYDYLLEEDNEFFYYRCLIYDQMYDQINEELND